MSRIQQEWLLPLIERDENFRERFYNDDHSLEPDYNRLPSINTVMVLIVTTNLSTLEKNHEENLLF
jgi:hypothetical protein